MTPLNTTQIRKDFPILERNIHGKQLIYLDNAATSQKPTNMLQSLQHFYTTINANVHRGVHTLSEEATTAYEMTRRKIMAFIHAKSDKEIVFTKNTTEAINLVAHGFVKPQLTAKDSILITAMEHHSNLLPWQTIAHEKNAQLLVVPITESGELDIIKVKELLAKKPKIFAVAHISNVLGTVNPVRYLVELAHEYNVPVLVDGAQAAPHMEINVQELDADFYAFSAHKMLGPTGVGILYGKRKYLEKTEPLLTGGGMVKEADYQTHTYHDIPQRFEAGTQNIADVVAFGAAIDYLEQVGMKQIWNHTQELTAYCYAQLTALPWIQVYGPQEPTKRGGVIAFNVLDHTSKIIHPHDVVTILDEDGIAVRSGHHCTIPLHHHLNLPSTTRVSFYFYNTKEEVDQFITSLHRVVALFNKTEQPQP